MGNDEANEGDQAADGNGRRGHKRSGNDDDEPRPGRIEAEGPSFIVANPKHIEVAAVCEQDGAANNDVGA